MRTFQVTLFFTICFISHLSYAGFFPTLTKNKSSHKVLGVVKKDKIKYVSLKKIPKEDANPNLAAIKGTLPNEDEHSLLHQNNPNSPSFNIIKHLNLLSNEELSSHMHSLASNLNIQPPANKTYEVLLSFTFFLELRHSGTKGQQNLVKAIIDICLLQHYYSSIENPSLKDERLKIPEKFWKILLEDFTPKEILNRTIFFNDLHAGMHLRYLNKGVKQSDQLDYLYLGLSLIDPDL